MKGGAKTQYTVIKESSGCYTVKPEGQTGETGSSSRGLGGRLINGLGAAAKRGQNMLKGRKANSTQPVLPPARGQGVPTTVASEAATSPEQQPADPPAVEGEGEAATTTATGAGA